jgi:hypothetical protein
LLEEESLQSPVNLARFAGLMQAGARIEDEEGTVAAAINHAMENLSVLISQD